MIKSQYGHLPLLIVLMLTGCEIEKPVAPDMGVPIQVPANEVIRIPVVVHVVHYSLSPFEISDEKIRSQIDVLNNDYRKQNSDWVKTPDEFIDLVADVGIEFYLATKDQYGNYTTGIIRTSGTLTGWDGHSLDGSEAIEDLPLYFTDKGGQDAWPNDRYLNIWIADLSDRNGNLRLAGYANVPGCDKRKDGVVVDPRAWGTLPPLDPSHQLGRTATHEIGHWLNLRHIFGKDGACEESADDGDLVDDTPVQKVQYNGTPVHPMSSCGSKDMFMNFMDYVDDTAMYMFTIGQKQRIRKLFNDGEVRRDLYLNVRNK